MDTDSYAAAHSDSDIFHTVIHLPARLMNYLCEEVGNMLLVIYNILVYCYSVLLLERDSLFP